MTSGTDPSCYPATSSVNPTITLMQSGQQVLFYLARLSGSRQPIPASKLLRRRRSIRWSLPKLTVRAVLGSVLPKRELVRAHRPRDADYGYAKVPKMPPTEDQMHRVTTMRVMYQEKHDMSL